MQTPISNNFDIKMNGQVLECDLRFKAPFTGIIAGPTSSGKSSIVFRLIKHRAVMINCIMKEVIYCLPPGQQIKTPDFIRDDRKVKFHSGIPDFSKIIDGKPRLVVLDDLMSNVNTEVMDLFTRGSHHKNISVLFLVQNIFFGGSKLFRTISLNAHYIILTKNPRDKNQINTLAVQVSPENSAALRNAFRDATKDAYSYLLFDTSQGCPDSVRFRANIFPDDNPRNIIYSIDSST